MEWWLIVSLFFGIFLILMFAGIPVVFAFLVTNIIIISSVIGFEIGLAQLVKSMYSAVTNFSLTPIPLFVLMGELLFYSGVALTTLNVINKLLGKLPGRLSVLSIASGTMFAALSGSSIANTSMLGSILAPEMKNKGYHTTMSIGPIMAAGSLAMIIPPSAMIVLMGGIASIAVGPLLIGGVIPGILMASLFIGYIIIACLINPSLAPKEIKEEKIIWKDMIKSFVFDIAPLFIIIFCVIGFILLGIATPTEAAAVGTLAALIIVALKKKLNYKVIEKSITGTLKISGMILLIVATSVGFGQLLSFSGASRDMVDFISNIGLNTLMVVIIFLLIVFLLGFFVEPISVMMITLPLFVPILTSLDVNLIWFGIMMLICLDLGNITPPVGMLLFVMKGVRPDVPMVDIYKSAIPFVLLELSVVILILIFPSIVLWLPGSIS